MAFNFNWSPLIADTSRARDMLTNALNKSPKPPIIVDDIIVTELNLGQVPPELEILEIGDLAEDRFRGIFKMCYTGDAFLTLKTRVQANPLNTYLSTKSSFASPQPLAAASSLTIPLSITLSDFKLSGFVILVFSRQKGITLVFRNDPLESLKVSSTFDSIPFVRDYLQKEIEKQLRTLFMEDLPAIIHRLSLRLFSPDQITREEERQREQNENSNEPPIDPLASPPQDPCDAFGRPLDDSELSALSPEHETEMHATFSQKNLLRLAALTDSHRTLSLFTPPIRDAVFRAWAGAAERGDAPGTATPSLTLASLSRQQDGSVQSTTTSVYSISTSDDRPGRRPSIATMHSAYGGSQMSLANGSKPRAHAGQRKRRNRVVNLRRSTDTASITSDDTASMSADATSFSGSRRSSLLAPSVSSYDFPYSSTHSREGELETPPRSPEQIKRSPQHNRDVHTASSQRLQKAMMFDGGDDEPTPRGRPLSYVAPADQTLIEHTASPLPSKRSRTRRQGIAAVQSQARHEAAPVHPSEKQQQSWSRASSSTSPNATRPTDWLQRSSTGSILEQAWMVKMANEIARKVHDEKARAAMRGFWEGNEGEEEGCRQPPPAYAA